MEKLKGSRAIQLLLIIAIVIFAACWFMYQFFSYKCPPRECAPARTFDVLDLGLPADLFPSTATYQPIQSVTDEVAYTIDEAQQTVAWDRGDAYYAIDRYDTIQHSIDGYQGLRAAMLGPSGSKSLFKPPDLQHSIRLRTTDFLVWCGTLSNNRKSCDMVLRYEEFVVYFSSNITEAMTLKDFEEVAAFIDEQMSDHLYSQ